MNSLGHQAGIAKADRGEPWAYPSGADGFGLRFFYRAFRPWRVADAICFLLQNRSASNIASSSSFFRRGGGVIEHVECVEADVPCRRRGDEHREVVQRKGDDQLAVKHDPVEAWIARAEQVPTALSAAKPRRSGNTVAHVPACSSISTSASSAFGRRKSRLLCR